MKRARFAEEQIVGMLREHEAGAKTVDLWKAKCDGMVGYLAPATFVTNLTTTCDRCATRTSSADRTCSTPAKLAETPMATG
jgi:hypothetical protein